MASWGFNFRGTAGHVTDGAGDVYVVPGDYYPTTRAGVTFGVFRAETAYANRSTTSDPRLAGIMYNVYGSGDHFRVDLPAPGTYHFRLAMGDGDFAQVGSPTIHLRESSFGADLSVIGPQPTGASQWVDATGVVRDGVAEWAADNAVGSFTIAGSSVFFYLSPSGEVTAISHIEIATTGGDAGQPTIRRFGGTPFAVGHGVNSGGHAGRMWGRHRSGLNIPGHFREAA